MKDFHLRVYSDRSEYHSGGCKPDVFLEGPSSKEAIKRLQNIRNTLKEGFLDELITGLVKKPESVDIESISEPTRNALNSLVAYINADSGRAIAGLTFMQLCIKSIDPDQSIRLHKSSTGQKSFSWREGMSMRSLDSIYITPILRKYNLVSLNIYGIMMTRTLAENYPYTPLYKAKIKGAKAQWIIVVEELELGNTSPLESLKYLISLLLNSANNLAALGDQAVENMRSKMVEFSSKSRVINLIMQHSAISDHSARLLEVGMHSLMQAVMECGALGTLDLIPLSQMRSANKKHGNIGDVELSEHGEIVEAWDAKFGKSYLRDELEEVHDKLADHEFARVIGFVTSESVDKIEEIDKRIEDLEELHDVTIYIWTFNKWVDHVFERFLATGMVDETALASTWSLSYIETLAQKRREIAPIDEPCASWLKSYLSLVQ